MVSWLTALWSLYWPIQLRAWSPLSSSYGIAYSTLTHCVTLGEMFNYSRLPSFPRIMDEWVWLSILPLIKLNRLFTRYFLYHLPYPSCKDYYNSNKYYVSFTQVFFPLEFFFSFLVYSKVMLQYLLCVIFTNSHRRYMEKCKEIFILLSQN